MLNTSKLINNAIHPDGLEGKIYHTNSYVRSGGVELELDAETAWALCNILVPEHITKHFNLDRDQHAGLIKLGESIAPCIDHPLNKAVEGGLSKKIPETKGSSIKVSTVSLSLDRFTAYALCNTLTRDKIAGDEHREPNKYLEESQHNPLIFLGAAIAPFVEHNNSMITVDCD